MTHTQGREYGSLGTLAEKYFHYLGTHFPQQCASDEFYLFPRAQAAIEGLDRLDDLHPERMAEHLNFVRQLLGETAGASPRDLEEEIDRQLMIQSMKSFIREMGEGKTWKRDPTLYIKVLLFAAARTLSGGDGFGHSARTNLSGILGQIPLFLEMAQQNLHAVPGTCLEMAHNMAGDAMRFLRNDVRALMEKGEGAGKGPMGALQEGIEALEQYREHLGRLPPEGSLILGEENLGAILKDSFGYCKATREVLEEVEWAYERTSESLASLRGLKDKGGFRRRATKAVKRPMGSPRAQLSLFRKEVMRLRRFFSKEDLIPFPPSDRVKVMLTPTYLRSLRVASSYRAPLTGHGDDGGVFYVAPWEEDPSTLLLHCPYLAAHETYPGHHVLDSFRIHHPNPIRRQIESPLFYEGWACYGEQLLDEFGYTKDPLHVRTGLKRRLWRILRAKLDIELHTGRTDSKRSAQELVALGYSPDRALRQVKRFSLTPGYQLCYFVGNLEILKLRERFSLPLGVKEFHRVLLEGGQLPFYLIERRLMERGNGQG